MEFNLLNEVIAGSQLGEGNTIKEQLQHYRNGHQLESCVNA